MNQATSNLHSVTTNAPATDFLDGFNHPTDDGTIKTGAYSIAHYNALNRKARSGELSIEQYHAAWQRFNLCRDDIEKRLNKWKKDQLAGVFKFSFYSKSDFVSTTKADMVAKALRRFHNFFLLHREESHTYFCLLSDLEKERKERAEKIKNIIENTSQADLNEYARLMIEAQNKREEKQKEIERAIENPVTLDDFRQFVSIKGKDQLTADQLKVWDDLHVELQAAAREEMIKRNAIVTGITGDEIVYLLYNTVHSQKGHELFVVQLAGERLNRTRFDEVLIKAKALGGYYSSYRAGGAIPGFQFFADEDRAKFVNVLHGNDESKLDNIVQRYAHKKDRRVAHLLAMADRLEEHGEEELYRERLDNTLRRAAMAASIEARAANQIRFASLLRLIAMATESGKVTLLANLRTQTELAELLAAKRVLINNAPSELIERDNESRRYWKNDVSFNDKVRFAEMPFPLMHRDNLLTLAKDMIATKGYIATGKQIVKAVNEEPDVNHVIEMKSASWRKRFDKIKSFARLQDVNSWGCAARAYEEILELQRLERIGINNLHALRAALRELMELQNTIAPVKIDENRALRRSLIGKKFNDFFDTPPAAGARVMEHADIKPGMLVLEPSAGCGNLALLARAGDGRVDVVEIAFELAAILQKQNFNLIARDFLQLECSAPIYDRIIMNPPFSEGQDLQHVKHAFQFLKPGGRLVAIVSSMAGNRKRETDREFSEWLDSLNAFHDCLPHGSFVDSINSTQASAKIIVINK